MVVVSLLCSIYGYNVTMDDLPLNTEPATDKTERIKIMLADDHPLLREALRHVLEKEEDFEIVAETSDGEETIRLATELVPDVLIIDISMPKISGIEATKQIKDRFPHIAVLALTIYDDSEHILGMLEAGAAGYLTKTVFGENVIHAVRGVIAGEAVLSQSSLEQIIRSSLPKLKRSVYTGAGEKITHRELEILRLAARGLSNKEISEELSISVRTVKGYLQNVFSKLNVASRTEAVFTCLAGNILTADDLK